MSETSYKSSLREYMHSYIQYKRNMGYRFTKEEFTLRKIDSFLVDIHFSQSYISEDIYQRWWKTTEGLSDMTRYYDAVVFRGFLKYMASLGVDCHIPRLPGRRDSNYVPYIFSEEELKGIFEASDRLRIKERVTKSVLISIPAILRLLYSTAIRVGEAVSLKLRNLDFAHHLIRLDYTKNGHQRIAPLNDSLESVLRQYISYRNRLPYPHLREPDSYLFVSSQGTPLTRAYVLRYFYQVLEDVGIEHKGNHMGPHIHSLRHSACVHAMVKLAKCGKPVYSSLPILSAFMGHRKVLDTEKYLRLTQEMYPDIMELDQTVTGGIKDLIEQACKSYGTYNENQG